MGIVACVRIGTLPNGIEAVSDEFNGAEDGRTREEESMPGGLTDFRRLSHSRLLRLFQDWADQEGAVRDKTVPGRLMRPWRYGIAEERKKGGHAAAMYE